MCVSSVQRIPSGPPIRVPMGTDLCVYIWIISSISPVSEAISYRWKTFR